MIILTRQNGTPFAINNDLIETIEEHPDTTLKMTDGKFYIVSESIDEIINKIILFRRECVKNIFGGIDSKAEPVNEDNPAD